MIIGTITLISILFLGGPVNYFPIEDIDKGIKKYVLDKERKKELLSEIKDIKKSIKGIYKTQNGLLKELKKLNANRNAYVSDYKALKEKLMENVVNIQDKKIDSRLRLISLIEDDEWEQMMDFSLENEQKRKAKEQKKGDKGKAEDPFASFEKAIRKHISDPAHGDEVLKDLIEYKSDYLALKEKVAERNVIDTPILKRKNSTREDLKSIVKEVNKLRDAAFDEMVEFHFKLKDDTTEEEWEKVIKAFNRLW
jgi:hypothetical protein